MLIGIRDIEEKYEILAKLGEGGMGSIFKARHKLLDENRVIKTIRQQLQEDQDLQQRFLREAKVAAKMRHPSIATLYDFAFTDDGTGYIVMELIEGQNLRDYQRGGGKLNIQQVVEIGRQGLGALGYLHAQNYVHRDISTDNMMLSWHQGMPKVTLIDLGLAKNLEGSQWRTKTGMVVGKVRYISPEQLNAGVEGVQVDARSDLYSFGVVLYELLTGEFPITGADDMSLIAGHLYRAPRPFEETDPQDLIPPQLRAVVMKALQKKPEYRFATAKEFVTALDQALAGDFAAEAYAVPADEQPTSRLNTENIQSIDPNDPYRPTATVGLQVQGQATQPAINPGEAPFTRPQVPQPQATGADTRRLPPDSATTPIDTAGASSYLAAATPVDTEARTAAIPIEGVPAQKSHRPLKMGVAIGAFALLALFATWFLSRTGTGGVQEKDRSSTGATVAASSGSPESEAAPILWGNYYAIVIGNNDYKKLPKLESAIIDAQAVASVLETRYGFEVTRIENGDRSQILNTIYEVGQKLTARDNLLIYYAGHGSLARLSQFWQGVDAEPTNSALWISTAHEVAGRFDHMSVRHVLVVSDSCFAGAVGTGESITAADLSDLPELERRRQLASRPSRLVMASGGLSPVLDAGSSGRHSVFAQAFLDALETNDGPIESSKLFEKIAPRVVAGALRLEVDQQPVLAPMPSRVDQGGQFFFVPTEAGTG